MYRQWYLNFLVKVKKLAKSIWPKSLSHLSCFPKKLAYTEIVIFISWLFSFFIRWRIIAKQRFEILYTVVKLVHSLRMVKFNLALKTSLYFCVSFLAQYYFGRSIYLFISRKKIFKPSFSTNVILLEPDFPTTRIFPLNIPLLT